MVFLLASRVLVLGGVGGALVCVGIGLLIWGRLTADAATEISIGKLSFKTGKPSLAVMAIGALLLGYAYMTPEPPPPPPPDVEGLNTEAVEAMRQGNLDRAAARLRKLLDWEGLEQHRYHRVVINNLGHVAFRKGDREQAREYHRIGRGGQLGNVLTWDEHCEGGDGTGCFKLGKHYEAIYVKNTIAYRDTGSFALRQYTRGCKLGDASSCKAEQRLAEIVR